MIFVDTNIFMYAAGADHPHKLPSVRFFEKVAQGKEEIAVSVEVLQEILYRFWAIRKIDQGLKLFEYAERLSHWILPVNREEVKAAKEMMSEVPGLSPRDALHAAVMKKNRISTIVSYDRHFDDVREIKRIEP